VIHAHWVKSVRKCLQDQYQITTFLFKSSLYNLQEDSDQLYISWLIILIKLTGSTLVIQTENKIFRLYILLLHTPMKSLMYIMMFYLSQPQGKNTLSFSANKLYQPLIRNPPSTGRCWCCLMSSSLFHRSSLENISILAYTSPHHLQAPRQVAANCHPELPVGSFSYCSY